MIGGDDRANSDEVTGEMLAYSHPLVARLVSEQRRPRQGKDGRAMPTGGGSGLGRAGLHDVVDQFLDLADQARRVAGGLASNVLDAAGSLGSAATGVAGATGAAAAGRPSPPAATGDIELLPTYPGTTTTADIELENTDRRQWVNNVRLSCAGLVARGGKSIDGGALEIHPAAVDLPPGQTKRVTLKLRVPADAHPGRYVGLLEADGQPDVQAVLAVRVR